MSGVAKEILDKYWDLLLPVKVDDIANRCGACILPLDDSLCMNYSGMTAIDENSGKKIIYYNPTKSEIRPRFTLAHELGHHLLGHTRYKNEFRDDFKDDFDNLFEIEATQFAAEILMPSGAILRLAGSKGCRTEYDLAVLFNVSIEAIHWKLINLGIIDSN